MQAVGQDRVVEMAEIGSAMSIGTVGSNPRGYTLLIMQVMHIPLHFSSFIFYAFSENVQLYGTVFFLKNSLFFQIFFQPQNPSKNKAVFRRVLGVGKRNMSFSKLAGGPNLADSFFQMAPDDDPDKFFVYLAALAVQGVGQASKWKRKKEEKIIIQKNIWKIGVVTTYLASIRQL